MSLIELLVVMVILAVGIFTIIRVFPQGFRYITHARNQTQANRLAQAEVERWKAYAANLPDGIEAEDLATGELYTDYNPNDMGNADLALKPNGEDENEFLWEWSNANRVRMVRGETTVIPSPTLLPYAHSGDPAYAIYNLKFAPIARHGDDPDHFILIYGDPLPRTNITELDSENREEVLEDLDREVYAIDFDSGTLYFQPAYNDREYRVAYNYWNGSRLVNTVETVTIQASANPGTDLSGYGPEQATLTHKPDPYSEQVARKFLYVDASQKFQRWDPYEYTLLSTYNAMTFAPTIGFNPVGANRTVRTNLGSRPLRAHIDYEVLDWHVIHEDRTVPSPALSGNSGYTLRLSLPGVKAAGRSYPGLQNVGKQGGSPPMVRYEGLTAGLAGYSVVALDLTDNTLMLDRHVSHVGPPPAGTLGVNYATGEVTIPKVVTKYTPFGASFNQDIGGHDIRIFYQATGDWAVQVTKAWSAYQRVDVPANNGGWSSLQYNNFASYVVAPGASIADLGYTNTGNRWAAVLVFPRKDAGHAISASFIWTDQDGQTHEVTGDERQLPEFATLSEGYPYLAIPFAPQNQYAPGQGDELWNNPNFTFVQGASLKVRVIWREDPRRWEIRDLETYINRK